MSENTKTPWTVIGETQTIWHARYFVPNFISRSVALKVAQDEWVVYSPGGDNLDSFSSAFPDAEKISLVLPNAFHNLGAKPWSERYPGSKIYCARKAAPRLTKLGLAPLVLEDTQPRLPEGFGFVFPEAERWGEVWISGPIDRDKVWITCDTFFNLARYSNHMIARTLQKLFSSAPGLRISALVKWWLVKNRRDFRAWVLREISLQNPTILVPSHGEVLIDADLSAKLTDIVNLRLG